MQTAVAPPPDPPELPDGARPRWPWWYGPLGFLAGAITGFISAGIVWVVSGVDDPSDSAGAIVVGTFLLDGSLVAVALLFASFVRRPRAWHFGLRRTAFWPAVGWAALGIFTFYVLAARFSVAVAAIIDGLVFGLIHFEGGTEGLLIVPPLALLGVIFCLVYEQTRSLYPVVALHAINNSIAYGYQADGAA